MARSHIRLMAGTLGDGGSDIFTVTVGRKVLLSSMMLSSETPVVTCDVELYLTPDGGSELLIMKATIASNDDSGRNPWPDSQPWITLYSGDAIRLHNATPTGGPNLNYVLSGIEYDPG